MRTTAVYEMSQAEKLVIPHMHSGKDHAFLKLVSVK